jgi:hypothetical protein
MIDLTQIQQDIFGLLMSAPQLQNVNIVAERKFITQQEIAKDAIWQTQRNGKSGCGILIEEPEVISDSPNVTGPPQSVLLSLVCFQNGDAAFTERGAGLFAAQIEQFVIDALHLQNIGGLGSMQVKGNFSSPARDYPGVNARRLRVSMTPFNTRQSPRTAGIAASVEGGLCALSCVTPGAAIYYTLDGSFPTDTALAIDPVSVTATNPQGVPINPQAQLYAAPFAVTSGQTIRAAAYAWQFNPGQIFSMIVP